MKFGLIGETLSYSYSQVIHTYLAKHYNIDMTYDLIETDDLPEINIENYDGLNVTIPYKQDVMTYLHYLHDSAKVLQSVNTIDNNLKGYNTDIAGFVYLMKKVDAMDYQNIVILGSGATSKMIQVAFKDKNIKVISRTGELNYTNYMDVCGDVLINTTPISMGKTFDELIVDEEYIKGFSAVIDLNYNPGISRFTNTCAKYNIKHTNGLDMLIIQAIKAFEIWHDLKVSDEVFNELKSFILNTTTPKKAIIGMPLSGKTTLFKDDKNACDLDSEIEKITGMSNYDYINFMGEEEFRKLETITLNDILKQEPETIILGGGIVKDFYNRLLLHDYQILFLNTPLDVLKQRYTDGCRPLLKTVDDLERVYNERIDLYNNFKTGDYNEDSSY